MDRKQELSLLLSISFKGCDDKLIELCIEDFTVNYQSFNKMINNLCSFELDNLLNELLERKSMIITIVTELRDADDSLAHILDAFHLIDDVLIALSDSESILEKKIINQLERHILGFLGDKAEKFNIEKIKESIYLLLSEVIDLTKLNAHGLALFELKNLRSEGIQKQIGNHIHQNFNEFLR